LDIEAENLDDIQSFGIEVKFNKKFQDFSEGLDAEGMQQKLASQMVLLAHEMVHVKSIAKSIQKVQKGQMTNKELLSHTKEQIEKGIESIDHQKLFEGEAEIFEDVVEDFEEIMQKSIENEKPILPLSEGGGKTPVPVNLLETFQKEVELERGFYDPEHGFHRLEEKD